MQPKERFLGPMPEDPHMRSQLLMDDDPVARQLLDDVMDEMWERDRPERERWERESILTAEDYATYIGPIPD